MTKKKTKAVRDLHASGHSAEAIASLLGLDVEAVRAALAESTPAPKRPKPAPAPPRPAPHRKVPGVLFYGPMGVALAPTAERMIGGDGGRELTTDERIAEIRAEHGQGPAGVAWRPTSRRVT